MKTSKMLATLIFCKNVRIMPEIQINLQKNLQFIDMVCDY